MLSLEKCKEILERDEEKYSYEQVKQVRDILYSFAAIEYDVFKNKRLQHESDNLHPRINRRTS
jgi:hypothetical protein